MTDIVGRFDVAVIGQGPAGMTAALYAARAGLSAVSFERMGPGGQMTDTEQLDNYPGFADGVAAFELAFAMSGQAARFGAQSVNEEVVELDLRADPKRIVVASGGVYEAAAVILATGAVPRPLGVDREKELAGRGVSYCATCDGGFSATSASPSSGAAIPRSEMRSISRASAPKCIWCIVAMPSAPMRSIRAHLPIWKTWSCIWNP